METSIAMGLVGIAVFASVSSFGGDIKGRISREIIPALGGGILSDPKPIQPASNNSPSNPELQIGYSQDENFGGIDGESSNGEESSADFSDDPSFVGGIAANPPTYHDTTDESSSSDASSLSDDNSFVAGTDASPPGKDGWGSSQSSSELADPSNTLW
jgi:hypothetical protein